MSQLIPGVTSIGRASETYILSTDKDLHFTGGIALNAIENETIDGLITDKIKITDINIQVDEARLYTLWLWKDSNYSDTDLDTDTFGGFINLDLATSGKQIAGAGQWYLDSANLAVKYEDTEPATANGTYQLHCGLMVSAGAAKPAGAAGEVQIDVYYSPRL